MVPFLVLLVFGIVDFGLYINAATVVGSAARDGARQASLGASTADVNSTVRSATSGLIGLPATAVLSCRASDGGGCSCAAAQAGDAVIVTVSYTHSWLTPAFPGAASTVVASSEMLIEIAPGG